MRRVAKIREAYDCQQASAMAGASSPKALSAMHAIRNVPFRLHVPRNLEGAEFMECHHIELDLDHVQ